MAQSDSLFVCGIGNTTVRIARAAFDDSEVLVTDVLSLPARDPNWSSIQRWLTPDDRQNDVLHLSVASVYRDAQQSLVAWLAKKFANLKVHCLVNTDFPIEILVDEPKRVGADRIAAGLAASRIREPGRAAIVVDVGTAINVDGLNREGAFVGGSILPGWNISANALGRQTDLLPSIDVGNVDRHPLALGTSTEKAIHSGLYWGAVGAVKEIVARITEELGDEQPELFVTGGGGREVTRHLAAHACYVDNLVLMGVALATQR